MSKKGCLGVGESLGWEKAAAVLKDGWVARKASECHGPAYRNEPNERSTRLVPQCNPYNLRKVRICISTTLQR